MSCIRYDEIGNYRYVKPRSVESEGALSGYTNMDEVLLIRDEERALELNSKMYEGTFGGQFNESGGNITNQRSNVEYEPLEPVVEVQECSVHEGDSFGSEEENPVVSRLSGWLKRAKGRERNEPSQCAEEPQCCMNEMDVDDEQEVVDPSDKVVCEMKDGVHYAVLSSPHLLFCLRCREGSPYGGKYCIHRGRSPEFSSEVLGPAAVQWQNSDEKLLGSGRGRGGFRGRRKRGKGKGRGMMGRPQTVFNRGRDYAPSRLRTHLVFDLRFTAPAASVVSPWSLEVILATNPNTFTLASTSVPGYTELAGLYRKYRVRSFKFIYSVINYESFGIEAFICPVNFLPSTVTDPTRYLSQGVATRRIVSAKGGKDNATLFKSSSITTFGGSANTTVEDAYVGTTDNSSPPSDNIYFIYGFMTNGAATVSPATNIINLKVLIDFFELQSPAT